MTDRLARQIPWSAPAIARRNGAGEGRPLNPVMKTAATASELAHHHRSEG